MATHSDALQLVRHIRSLSSFPHEVLNVKRTSYGHMGATICDTVLQAGLNYRTVVAPRINRLLARWSSARTTSSFDRNIRRYGLTDVLSWRDHEKPRRIRALTLFFLQQSIETEADAANWLACAENVSMLRTVRGIGPKSADYLKMLVGIPAVAVDRHLRQFVANAGLGVRDYAEAQAVICRASTQLGFEAASLDYAIWLYVSSQPLESRRIAA